MRALVRLLSLVALTVSAVACGGSDDVDVVTDAAGFSVGLIDQGDEPLVELRVPTTSGTTQSVQMVIDQTMVIEAAGRSIDSGSSQTMDVTYTVVEADDDAVTFETRYDAMNIDSDDPGAAEVNQALTDVFVGSVATTRMTDRGAIISFDFDPQVDKLSEVGIPGFAQVMDQMLASFDDNASSMSIPTPVEPVGVGASWSAAVELELLDLPISVETTVTLTEISEGRATGTIEQVMTVEEGDVDPLGTGQTAKLHESRLVGTGTITYLLDGGIVPLFDMTISGTMSFEVSGETFEQQLEMHQMTRPL